MNEGYGIPSHGAHPHVPHRPPARYLVLIDAGGTSVARLFGPGREPVGEFMGGSDEVRQMTRGLQSTASAADSEWDAALQGHNPAERAAAQVYTLDV